MRATANEVQAIRVLLVEDEFLISEWVAETLVWSKVLRCMR